MKKLLPEIHVAVRDSKIAGKGGFAIHDLKAGTKLGYYKGKRYSAKALAKKDWDLNLTYLFELSDGITINGAENGSILRFINHSCNPNVEASEIRDKDDKIWIRFDVIRDVKKGEELFLDYNLSIGDENPKKFKCFCGYKKCRKTMAALPE